MSLIQFVVALESVPPPSGGGIRAQHLRVEILVPPANAGGTDFIAQTDHMKEG